MYKLGLESEEQGTKSGKQGKLQPDFLVRNKIQNLITHPFWDN